MYLAVFAEFKNAAVLKAVEELGIAVNVAGAPNEMAVTEVEKDIVATNAKLMLTRPPQECTFAKVSGALLAKAKSVVNTDEPVSIASALSAQEIAEIKAQFNSVPTAEVVDATLEKLVKLGFEVTHRNPMTSTGCAMTDRVILKYKGE